MQAERQALVEAKARAEADALKAATEFETRPEGRAGSFQAQRQKAADELARMRGDIESQIVARTGAAEKAAAQHKAESERLTAERGALEAHLQELSKEAETQSAMARTQKESASVAAEEKKVVEIQLKETLREMKLLEANYAGLVRKDRENAEAVEQLKVTRERLAEFEDKLRRREEELQKTSAKLGEAEASLAGIAEKNRLELARKDQEDCAGSSPRSSTSARSRPPKWSSSSRPCNRPSAAAQAKLAETEKTASRPCPTPRPATRRTASRRRTRWPKRRPAWPRGTKPWPPPWRKPRPRPPKSKRPPPRPWET